MFSWQLQQFINASWRLELLWTLYMYKLGQVTAHCNPTVALNKSLYCLSPFPACWRRVLDTMSPAALPVVFCCCHRKIWLHSAADIKHISHIAHRGIISCGVGLNWIGFICYLASDDGVEGQASWISTWPSGNLEMEPTAQSSSAAIWSQGS